ncbi:MAG: hypothetical protein ACR2K5_07425 [Pseudolabrys sp.]
MRAVNLPTIIVCALTFAAPAPSARAQSDSDIMAQENGTRGDFKAWGVPLPKPVRRAHGSSNQVYPARLPQPDHFVPLRAITAEPNVRAVPPYVVSPDTGRALPNLPTLRGSGLGGAETGQDRAVRCAHQAGVYGETGGSYLGTCINQ